MSQFKSVDQIKRHLKEQRRKERDKREKVKKELLEKKENLKIQRLKIENDLQAKQKELEAKLEELKEEKNKSRNETEKQADVIRTETNQLQIEKERIKEGDNDKQRQKSLSEIEMPKYEEQLQIKSAEEEIQKLECERKAINDDLNKCCEDMRQIAHEEDIEEEAKSSTWSRTRQRGDMPTPEYNTIKVNIAELSKIITKPIILLNNMLAMVVFDRDDEEKIQKEYKENGSRQTTRLILLTLLACGAGSFDKFLECLTPECCEKVRYQSVERGKKEVNLRDVIQEEENDVTEYVGRHDLRKFIVDKLREYWELFEGRDVRVRRKIIYLHGEGKVGKQRLARRALLDFKREYPEDNIKAIHVSCLRLDNWQHFLNRFSQNCLGKTDMKEDDILNAIKDVFKDLKMVVLITSSEAMNKYHKKFEFFVLDILKRSSKVNIIVTSRVADHFDASSFKIPVESLTDTETINLFESVLLEIDSEQFKPVVLEHCQGLPPYILDAAAFLNDGRGLGIAADDLKEYLLSESHRKRISVNDSDELTCLSDDQRKKIADLMIFRGSFGREAFLALAERQDLFDFKKRSIIKTVKDTDSKRMAMTKFYYDAMLVQGVTYSDTARLQFVKYFGQILQHATDLLYTESYDTVYGYLKEDWKNVEHALKEAIHGTSDVYTILKQVGVDADDLIVNCSPAVAVTFYETMIEVTDIYGDRHDKAILTSRLARAVSMAKGDQMDKASGLFEESLSFLEDEGASVHLISLLQYYGFTLYKREKLKESFNCFKKAIMAADQLKASPRVVKHVISLRSLISIIRIAEGNYQIAKQLLHETINGFANDFPLHSALPIMTNSLGIIYEKNGDAASAMKYYKNSLSERRKAEKIFPLNLIIPLNRISFLLMNQRKYKEALPYLKEAYVIRRNNCKIDTDMALTLRNLGRAYLMLHDYPESRRCLEESLQIYNKCISGNRIYLHIQLMLAHCHILTSDVDDARSCLESAVRHGKTYKEQFQNKSYFYSAIGHLLMLVQSEKCFLKEALNDLQEELMRYKEENGGENPEIDALYTGCECCLEELDREKQTNFQFLNYVHKICDVCKEMDAKEPFKSEDVWKSATEKVNSAAERRRRLTQSDNLTAALFSPFD